VRRIIDLQSDTFATTLKRVCQSVLFHHSSTYCIPVYSHIRHTFHTPKSMPKSSVSHWHNLGGNTIIMFFNINNEYMNNKQID